MSDEREFFSNPALRLGPQAKCAGSWVAPSRLVRANAGTSKFAQKSATVSPHSRHTPFGLCGGTVPMPPFGISIKEFARLCNEGVEAHRGCEEAGNGEAEAGEPAASPVGVLAAAHGAVGAAE